MRILVAYASKHGSTKEIAQAIEERLLERGAEARLFDVRESEDAVDMKLVDAVVLGSAIYYGHWMHDAVDFAKKHHDALASRPLFFFSSGPVAGDGEDDEDRAMQPKDALALAKELAVRDHALFGGKLDLDAVSFGERMVIKFVGAKSGDARNFEAIRAWADAVADDLLVPKR